VQSLRPYCAGLHVARLHPRLARLASLRALPRGQALSLAYFEDAGLRRWVGEIAARESLDAAVVFCSPMVQYLDALPQPLPMLLDFVDVDSAKWAQYAPAHRWPMSWVYAREGRTLLSYERAAAARSVRSFFVTDAEAAMFRGLAPECADKVGALGNGVDAEFFTPDAARPSPYGGEPCPLVFTGAMDYWPNVDAVCWFAREVLPQVLQRWPQARLHIVGRSPTAAVQALAGAHVSVSGTVPDVRPYLQHAAVVVAPLRLARGVQNKILEAMAMARPVVASLTCTQAIDAQADTEVLPALEAKDYVQQIDLLLSQPERAAAIGQAGRQRVLRNYSWDAHLAGIDPYLAGTALVATNPARVPA
jgi:sugar transferase (PEP-CTERM/EpsH1 system associated)